MAPGRKAASCGTNANRERSREMKRTLLAACFAVAILPVGRAADADPDKRAAAIEAETEAKLSNIVVPKLDFHEADLRQVVAFLHERAVDLDPDGEGVNFVVNLREEVPKVTVSLKNVSLRSVLRVITMLTDTDYELEENIVIIQRAPPEEREEAGESVPGKDKR